MATPYDPGYEAQSQYIQVSDKSRTVVTLLAFFLGLLGIHRFYLGKFWSGLLMMLTGGGFGVWWLIDFIMALTGLMRDTDGLQIRHW